MGLFFPDDKEQYTGLRKSGFPRYREVLEGSWKDFLKTGFITLLFYIPLAAGLALAVLSSSLLVAVLAGIIGGAVAGPGYACLVDLILRRLRDDKGDWWTVWKRAMGQNWRDAILPGILQNLFLSVIVYAGALMLWGAAPLTPATVLFLLLATVVVIMLTTVWWPQIVLFSGLSTVTQLKNSVLFILKYPGKILLSAFLQLVWWAIMFLLLPWTAFVVPPLGIWYILFLALHLIYPSLDEAFDLEERIAEKFPGRVDND